MNKKQKITIAIILLVAVVSIIYLIVINSKENKGNFSNSDEIKFKNEYETLNSKKKDDGTNEYINVNISGTNKIKYSNITEVINTLKNGTGVIYLGFPECPWCRTMISPFIDVVSNYSSLHQVLYYDAREIRDSKHLDENGNIVVDKAGTEEYNELVSILYDYLDVYYGLNDPTIKRLYLPTVIFVKNGKVIGVHNGTLDAQTDVKVSLTEDQIKELKGIYTGYLDKMFSNNDSDDISCDDSKKC